MWIVLWDSVLKKKVAEYDTCKSYEQCTRVKKKKTLLLENAQNASVGKCTKRFPNGGLFIFQSTLFWFVRENGLCVWGSSVSENEYFIWNRLF